MYFFRLILIAEKDTVYQKFPIPLINRLEKHFVLISSILEEWQGDVVKVLEEWVKDFAMIRLVLLPIAPQVFPLQTQ